MAAEAGGAATTAAATTRPRRAGESGACRARQPMRAPTADSTTLGPAKNSGCVRGSNPSEKKKPRNWKSPDVNIDASTRPVAGLP